MFFLVLFQFCSFNVHQFDLSVQVFLDGIIFLYLLVKVPFFLVDGLFFLPDPALGITDLLVFFKDFFIMGRSHLHELFLGLQFFFLPDVFRPSAQLL